MCRRWLAINQLLLELNNYKRGQKDGRKQGVNEKEGVGHD